MGDLGIISLFGGEKKTTKINPKKERKISIIWTLHNLVSVKVYQNWKSG